MREVRPGALGRASLPSDEEERLRALRDLGLLDTPAEDHFDRPTRLASRECDRDGSYCATTILGDDILVLPDTAADARFADSPLVTDGGIWFYAGCPLCDTSDRRLGTFCLMDTKLRQFSAARPGGARRAAPNRLVGVGLDE